MPTSRRSTIGISESEAALSKLEQVCLSFKDQLWSRVEHNYEKSYAVWLDFWRCLIAGGWPFDDDDLVQLNDNIPFPEESHYSLAVRINHIPFCRAYEKLHRRSPFLWNDINYDECYIRLLYSIHATKAKARGRLILGAQFMWKGEKVRVTSFNDEKQQLVACSYQIVQEAKFCDSCHRWMDNPTKKIVKRFTITAQELHKAKLESEAGTAVAQPQPDHRGHREAQRI